jgi:hypothetical protein
MTGIASGTRFERMRLRLSIRSIANAAARAALVAVGLAVVACSAIEHGYRTGDVSGQTLAMADAAAAERLRIESAYDRAVGEFVASAGRPDYLHVLDRDHLYLFYLKDDRVAIVVRDGKPPGAISEQSPIPGHFFRLLPAHETQRIEAARAAYKAAHSKPRRAPRTASAPASPVRDTNAAALSLSGFDLETLIARFKQPMSAADPGVSGWREIQLDGGGRSGVARAGNTEFAIRPDFVSAATRVTPSIRRTPPEVRNSYVRVNRAVFGTRAHAISEGVASLVDQVVADPSGRTRIARRIAGRTVSVVRDTERGLLVYGIRSD